MANQIFVKFNDWANEGPGSSPVTIENARISLLRLRVKMSDFF